MSGNYQKALLAVDLYKEEQLEESMYDDWMEEYGDYQDEWSLYKNVGALAVGGLMAFVNPFGMAANMGARFLLGMTLGSIGGNVGHYLTHPSAREDLKPFDFGGKFDSGYEREAERAMKEGEISGWDSFNMAFMDVVDFVKAGGLDPGTYAPKATTAAGNVASVDPSVDPNAVITPKPAGPIDKLTGNFEVGDVQNLYDTTTNTWEDAVMTADNKWWVGDPMTGHEIGLQDGDVVTAFNYRNVMQPTDPKVYSGGELSNAWGTYEAGVPAAPLNKWGSQPYAFGQGMGGTTAQDAAAMANYFSTLLNTYNMGKDNTSYDEYEENLEDYI